MMTEDAFKRLVYLYVFDGIGLVASLAEIGTGLVGKSLSGRVLDRKESDKRINSGLYNAVSNASVLRMTQSFLSLKLFPF